MDLSTGNDVDNLAVAIADGSGTLVFGDTDGLTITTVDGVVGVTTNASNIDLTAGGDDNVLTVSQAITTGGGGDASSVSLTADNMAITAAVTTGTNGVATLAPEVVADLVDAVNLEPMVLWLIPWS